jgi:REP element-mobilizing transposase RayT
MARRPRIIAPGLLYHVIARGNQRRPTFLTPLDYDAYLVRLAAYRERYGVRLFAYCLMPNHVHLLLQTGEPPLPKFMQGLQQSYTQRFNRVHEKVGHVFQGRYRAIVCDRDEYLVTLVRYIHLNPVRAGLVERPEAYPHSGHRAYLGRAGQGLVDPGPALGLLGGRDAYERYVLDGIGAGHEDRYYRTDAEQILGPAPFAERVGREVAGPMLPRARLPVDAAVADLAGRLGVDSAVLRGPDRGRAASRARAAVSFALVRHLGYRVSDVAAALGRDAATISVIVNRTACRVDSAAGATGEAAQVKRAVRNCLEVKA